MIAFNVPDAKKKLSQIIESIQLSHEPVAINGKIGSVIMISEKDWRSIEETIYLTSIPGMRESIISGLKEPLENCKSSIKW